MTELSLVTRGELPCWQLRHGNQRLLIAEQGAQLLEYQCEGQPPIIWLSDLALYQQGQGVRGGIPVCWPWFGDLRRNPEALQAQYPQYRDQPAPAHGLARTLPWQWRGAFDDNQQIGLDFALPSLPQLPGLQARLRVSLSDRLMVTLISDNQGDQPVLISQALHSYLAVSDCRQIAIQGLQQCPYVDALNNWQTQQQQGALEITEETDRLYLQVPRQLTVVDPGWQRQLILTSEGSASAVVWNPWIEKSQTLSQFGNDAWQQMLCIETARVLDDLLVLAPGQQQRMSISLQAQPLT